MPDLPIRASLVFLFVLRPTAEGHEVLLLQRTQTLAGEWSQISGRMEEGETAWETALRELNEETKLAADQLFSSDITEIFYGKSTNTMFIAPVFVVYVSPQAEVKLNFEHSDFRWVSFDEAVEMVPYGGQRRMLRLIEEDYSKRQPSRHFEIDLNG